MNYPNKKSQVALAITAVIGLAGCTTNDSKVASEEEEQQNNKPQVVVIKDDKQPVVKEIAEIDAITQSAIPEPQKLKTEFMDLSMKQAGKMKHDRRIRAEEKRLQAHQIIGSSPAVSSMIRMPSEQLDRENYAHFDDNSIQLVSESPVSTFSIDVDTGAYTNVRRILNQGQLPRKDAIRAEEFINYFNYDFAPPANNETPFAVHSEMMKSPWNENSYLLQLGIKAWEPVNQQRPDANLVFLMDVSGSMNSADKLGLLKKSLILLTRQLSARDRISMVVYAGASGIVLEPTAGNQTTQIEMALQRLQAGGSTNGAAGIKLAYQLAEKSFIKGGINRILLATDGDFNVGTTNFDALTDLVQEKRKSGIALSTLGFGSGNYNDHLMEQLADKGNGQYSYIDTILEAKKVLVDEMNASLLTVASDVKIQLEFNPQVVTEYRLIGYENRALAREDFNNDKVDAGDIGAGHTVTALYEVRFSDSKNASIDALRYSNNRATREANVAATDNINELGFLKLRYKNPGQSTSKLITSVLDKNQLKSHAGNPSGNIQFAASVAGFAQQLRGGKHLDNFSYQQIAQLAQSSKGKDPRGLRGEFLQLVSLAELLSQQSTVKKAVAGNGG